MSFPTPPLLALLPLLVLGAPALAQNDYLSPEQSAARMKVPEGFRVSLFAGEPDIRKPIAMTTDDRGRLWVVENSSYPHWLPEGQTGTDRILIFEDGGDGKFKSRKVFLDNGTNLSGIAVGFGGVWLCAAPHLLFLPLKPGEDKPAGPAQVVLEGWSLKAKHNVFNNLHWGPDGWLYGCNGITDTSFVGKPGTPKEERTPMNCGVWRYHPVKKVFEPFAWGTTNPWGLDWDDHGELFITNCVIKHLFHLPQGAHFVRMFGQDLNPHCYGLMESCADHQHWAGGHWTTSRGGLGAHSDSGGGHAHAGAMVYLGDNWPESYRNRIFMGNLHGARLNQDLLEHHGSGYVARHGLDFLFAQDPWFRPLVLLYGPDGGVFLADWHDTGECHNYDKTHPSGRIYKITFGQPRVTPFDLAGKSDAELVELQKHRNEWYVRHSRRLLQERAMKGQLAGSVAATLKEMLNEPPGLSRRSSRRDKPGGSLSQAAPQMLRALWALHAIGAMKEPDLLLLLDHPEESLRGWAIRLLVEDRTASKQATSRLAEVARKDSSPYVRLALASGLQRLPPGQRWDIAAGLLDHAEDVQDANLPWMYWYGIESAVPTDTERAAQLLPRSKIPLVRSAIARRLADLTEGRGLRPLVRLLQSNQDIEVLRGMLEALMGRRQMQAPAGWDAASRNLLACSDAEVRQKTLLLSVVFGDRKALETLRRTVTDSGAPAEARKSSLQMLVDAHAPELVPLLRQLLDDPALRRSAIQGLAAVRDPQTPALLLAPYSSLPETDRNDILATLASRVEFAQALMDAVEAGKVPARDLSPFLIRQMMSLKDASLRAKIGRVWGSIQPADLSLLPRYLSVVPPDALKQADRSGGRALFNKHCATCHALFNEGGRIGPELTGSQRTNPEYLLTKLLAPNAVVARDYLMTVVTTRDGRTISGLVKEENEQVVVLQTATEAVRIAKSDIEERSRSNQSLMPVGLLQQLSDREVRDLVAYLAGPDQVPAAKGPVSLFDGKTLTGWEGDTAKTWRVEDDCIVGGDLDKPVPRNEFLCTTKTYGDFELKVKFKLLGDRKTANAGVQFRSKRIPNHHEVIGYQADVGQAYWGALYDESRRKRVLAQPDPKLLEKIVKHDDWNEYVIRCEGPRIRLWLNGTLTVDYTEPDDKIERSGIIGLQVHGGGRTKVFYKDIQIEELSPATKPEK